MPSRALALAALSILLSSSGCATIVKGRYQDLTVNSNPPGAAFEVDGITGTTPATVPVERKLRYHTVTISKPGYETAQIRVGRDINMWTAGNVIWGLFGLPIGVGIDLVNGSAFKLASQDVQVDLKSENSMANQPITIGSSLQVPQIIEAQHGEPPPVATPPQRPGGQQ
jgi:hypothetical protein